MTAQGLASSGLATASYTGDAAVSPAALHATRWHFVVLCMFLAAQAYTIPLIPISVWAVWPGLADFALTAVFPLLFFARVQPHFSSSANRRVMRYLVLLFGLSLLSFLLFRLIIASTPGGALAQDSGFEFGIFQLYRLVQFFAFFWVVMHTPIDRPRQQTLAWIATGVLVVIAAGVFASYTRLVSVDVFVAHLPPGPRSGPWNIYFTYANLGLSAPFGTVGYNHSYTGAQVLLLVAFIHRLRIDRLGLLDMALLGLGVFTVFISESRAGLVAILFYALIFFARQPRFILLGAFGLLGVVMLIALGVIRNPLASIVSEETLERSQTLLQAADSENLSDRDIIWAQRLAFLNADLSRWLIGSGFGNASNSGNNAHMLPLHIIVETGVVGLAVFASVAYGILRLLWRHDVGVRPIFWCTVALIISSATQETFYPVPSLGYFLAFYLAVVAITLNAPDTSR